MNRKIKTILSEEDLTIALANHTNAGAIALYDQYASKLFKVICGKVQQQELAEEILRQTFIKIWNAIGQYQVREGRLSIWIMGIARSLSNEALNASQVKPTVQRNKRYSSGLRNTHIRIT
jgi:DNA-directed RNA polymerase specialized sigma24 family protein